jgi:shikimate kinase
MKHSNCIILMGMKHTGKSTLGLLLSQKLAVPFYDTDTVITGLSGKTPRELYASGGAALMMEQETVACRYLSTVPETRTGCVIATGGGLADNEAALDILVKTGTCIYLDTPFETLFNRIQESAHRDGRLPGFLSGPDPRSLFLEIYSRRTKIYETRCDALIHAENRNTLEIAQEIMDTQGYEQGTNFHS